MEGSDSHITKAPSTFFNTAYLLKLLRKIVSLSLSIYLTLKKLTIQSKVVIYISLKELRSCYINRAIKTVIKFGGTVIM